MSFALYPDGLIGSRALELGAGAQLFVPNAPFEQVQH